MLSDEIKIKYIGGPTALLEIDGLRLLTDPTFDPQNTKYPTPVYTLHKLSGPSINVDNIGPIDIVLLSHDHHKDNLDNLGRKFLPDVKQVITTLAGAERLGGNATGIDNWQTIEVATPNNRHLLITGTPCRHGPPNGDRGPVTGFLLQFKGEPDGAVYITGDTVWYEGVEEVARKYNIGMVMPFIGAATVKEVGPDHLTMTVDEVLLLTQTFIWAKIVPLHFEGWGHFTETVDQVNNKFNNAGLLDRLKWPHTFSE